MGYNFVGADRDQPFLMPPSLTDWLPAGHLAWFLVDAVDQFDLTEFHRAYRADGRGGAAHDPAMMVALLLYAYCIGVVSSRKIEAACTVDVAFRVVAGNLVPDHATIARFRAAHAEALAGLFSQVLAMCAQAGLAKAGTVAIDGTKMSANASMEANRSLESITRQMQELLDAAADTDAAEDAQFGEGVRGDEVPEELRDRSTRRARLAAAKKVLEDKAAAEQAAHQAHLADRAAKEAATGKKLRGRKPKAPAEKAENAGKTPRANTTDPDSRLLSTRNGFVQGYNAQATANEAQIILAAEVTQNANDAAQLVPMLAATSRELVAAGIDEGVGVVLADAGYASEAVLAGLPQGLDFYIATRNMRHGKPRVGSRGRLPADASLLDKMDRKVSRKAGRVHYDKRKWIIEPVFGQIKTAQRITGFARRGLKAAAADWKLIALTHNLRKLHQHALRAAQAAALLGPAPQAT